MVAGEHSPVGPAAYMRHDPLPPARRLRTPLDFCGSRVALLNRESLYSRECYFTLVPKIAQLSHEMTDEMNICTGHLKSRPLHPSFYSPSIFNGLDCTGAKSGFLAAPS